MPLVSPMSSNFVSFLVRWAPRSPAAERPPFESTVGASSRVHPATYEVSGIDAEDIEPVLAILTRMRVSCQVEGDRLVVHRATPHAIRQVTTAPWPGFPSDMVSLVSVLATQADGATLVHDWMYELRLFALEQLSGMGADIFLCDPHRMIINGPRKLKGRVLDTRDLRSGMALIAAALAADGISRVGPLETVERGYANLVVRLQHLGAQVSVEVPGGESRP